MNESGHHVQTYGSRGLTIVYKLIGCLCAQLKCDHFCCENRILLHFESTFRLH